MAEGEVARQSVPSVAASGATVRCATCGAPVDPLRAARVAVFGERFYYYCSHRCRDEFALGGAASLLPTPRSSPDPLLDVEFSSEHTPLPLPSKPARDANALPSRPEEEDSSATASEELEIDPFESEEEEPPTSDEGKSQRALENVVGPTDIGTLLLILAMGAAGLGIVLFLAGDSAAVLTARVTLVAIASGALAAQGFSPGRDVTELHPLVLTSGPTAAALGAVAARVSSDPATSSMATVAGLLVAVVAASVWLVRRARQPIDAEREGIAAALRGPGHRVVGDVGVEAPAEELRPGEEIVVEEAEVLPVDATIVAGSAVVLPWLGAKTTTQRSEGDAVVAGARVVEGRFRAIVGWAEYDRAWMRLTNDPRRRADVLAPLARAGRHLAERGCWLAAGIAALAAFSSDRGPFEILSFAVVGHVVFANAAVAQVAALYVARTVARTLRRGIAFRTADALDRAGKVNTGAFCARGTLLLGEPDVASIEPMGGEADADTVLSMLAGAETGATHPTAVAILRAARARGIRPDAVRSPKTLPGLGVTAVASSGQPLVVGSRALMLRERIGIASAEARISDLEAMGRSVLLVALGGRLIGVVGLQDGLRPGARAAVQHLLDVGVEPVLLSGDARETCEALGRAVDIEHIRPEVLPAERGEEIRRLADGGPTVAVLGRSPADDVALAAADVSVALASAGSSTAEWHVQLASDDVRDAAYAIRAAIRCRRDARAALALALAPGGAVATLMAAGFAPPAVVPLATLGGALIAVLRLRSLG